VVDKPGLIEMNRVPAGVAQPLDFPPQDGHAGLYELIAFRVGVEYSGCHISWPMM